MAPPSFARPGHLLSPSSPTARRLPLRPIIRRAASIGAEFLFAVVGRGALQNAQTRSVTSVTLFIERQPPDEIAASRSNHKAEHNLEQRSLHSGGQCSKQRAKLLR